MTDLERSATGKLPKMIGDYYNEGAMDLITYVRWLWLGGTPNPERWHRRRI